MKYLKSFNESTLRYPQHAELSLSLVDDINDLLLELSDIGLSCEISNESTLIAKKTSDIKIVVKSWDFFPDERGVDGVLSDPDIAPEAINGLLRLNDYMESKGYKYLDTITGRHRIDIPLEKRLRHYGKLDIGFIRINYCYVNCIIPGCECKE